MSRRRTYHKRKRRRNPSLADIDSFGKIVIVGAVIVGVVYFGEEIGSFVSSIFNGIGSFFSSVAQVPAQVINAETASLTQAADSTDSDIANSLGVGVMGN